MVGVVCSFKQNTAYERRISDWSSDVCSSDLEVDRVVERLGPHDAEHRAEALRAVEPGTRGHTVLQPWRPEAARVVEALRLDEPALAWIQVGQGTEQLVGGRLDERSHGGAERGGPAGAHRAHPADQLAHPARAAAGRPAAAPNPPRKATGR